MCPTSKEVRSRVPSSRVRWGGCFRGGRGEENVGGQGSSEVAVSSILGTWELGHSPLQCPVYCVPLIPLASASFSGDQIIPPAPWGFWECGKARLSPGSALWTPSAVRVGGGAVLGWVRGREDGM